MCQHWLLTYVPYVCTSINPRHRYCIGGRFERHTQAFLGPRNTRHRPTESRRKQVDTPGEDSPEKG